MSALCITRILRRTIASSLPVPGSTPNMQCFNIVFNLLISQLRRLRKPNSCSARIFTNSKLFSSSPSAIEPTIGSLIGEPIDTTVSGGFEKLLDLVRFLLTPCGLAKVFEPDRLDFLLEVLSSALGDTLFALFEKRLSFLRCRDNCRSGCGDTGSTAISSSPFTHISGIGDECSTSVKGEAGSEFDAFTLSVLFVLLREEGVRDLLSLIFDSGTRLVLEL